MFHFLFLIIYSYYIYFLSYFLSFFKSEHKYSFKNEYGFIDTFYSKSELLEYPNNFKSNVISAELNGINVTNFVTSIVDLENNWTPNEIKNYNGGKEGNAVLELLVKNNDDILVYEGDDYIKEIN